MTTTHRPTPQPSIANRSRPLMQTFHTSTPAARSATLDAAVLPNFSSDASSSFASSTPRVPLLPDNYSAIHPSEVSASAAASTPEITIVATDPDNVLPSSSLIEVASADGPDGVDLGFMSAAQEKPQEGNMLTDLLKGMVDDVFGAARAAKKAT